MGWRRIVVGLGVGVGILTLPWLVGSVGLALLGSRLAAGVARADDSGDSERTLRAPLLWFFVGVALTLASQLSTSMSVAARGLFCLALVPMAHVPHLAMDERVGWGRALARSVDRCASATLSELRPALVLAFVFAVLPAGLELRELTPEGRVAMWGVAGIGGLSCVEMVSSIARQWEGHVAAARPLRAAGVMTILFSLAAALYFVTALDLGARVAFRGQGVYVGVPAGAEWTDTPVPGVLLSFETIDGVETDQAVLLRADPWPQIDVVDAPAWHDGVIERARGWERWTPQHAATPLVFIAISAALLLGLGWLARHRMGRLRALMGRLVAVEARVEHGDLAADGERWLLRAGSMLRMVQSQSRITLTRDLAVRGAPEEGLQDPRMEPRGELELHVLMAADWRQGTTYREGAGIPADAFAVFGDPDEALAEVRLRTTERLIYAAAFVLVPGSIAMALLRHWTAG